jgi:hypothetical protein
MRSLRVEGQPRHPDNDGRADISGHARARNISVKFHAHVTNQPCAADVAPVGVTISVACAAFAQARLLSMGLVAEGARP